MLASFLDMKGDHQRKGVARLIYQVKMLSIKPDDLISMPNRRQWIPFNLCIDV
jgi:NMD protein affecting ribosome stability and mRNA decay